VTADAMQGHAKTAHGRAEAIAARKAIYFETTAFSTDAPPLDAALMTRRPCWTVRLTTHSNDIEAARFTEGQSAAVGPCSVIAIYRFSARRPENRPRSEKWEI